MMEHGSKQFISQKCTPEYIENRYFFTFLFLLIKMLKNEILGTFNFQPKKCAAPKKNMKKESFCKC